MMLCGLTGGVGMGKSTAAGFLLAQGVRVVDTDDLAHQLVQSGQPALVEITKTFGEEMLSAAGELNRAKLAARVFADPVARRQLEAILHPRIREAWLRQLKNWRADNCPLAVVVIPLLFETAAENHFEKIICVASSGVTQRARLAARGWNPEQIQQRVAAQLPTEEKMARAHFVVWTEGEKEIHRRQIDEILGKI